MNLYVWDKSNLKITTTNIVVLTDSPASAIALVRSTSLPVYSEIQQFRMFDLPQEQIIAIQSDPNKTLEQRTAEVFDLLDTTFVTETGFTSKAILPTEYDLNQERIFTNL